MDYAEKYLNKLPLNVWIEIRSLPNIIGLATMAEYSLKQPLKGKTIIVGKYWATFKIIKKSYGKQQI
jgi:hypothetical protein